MFHILVSIRWFKEVELRVLLTVCKRSLVFPPPQAKPEMSSWCLSWSCSPAGDSNHVLIQLCLKVTVHSSDLNYSTWNTAVSAHCSSVTSSLPCPKRTAVLQSLCPRFNHWGLLICRLNISFAWTFTNIFFFFLFFSSPPPSFSQQSELTSHLLLLLHPKCKKFPCLQLPPSSMAVVCTGPSCVYILHF